MDWLEVSLVVDGELAEAVADVLARHASNGVTVEQGIGAQDDENMGAPSGPITVRAYLPIDRHIEARRAKLQESLHYLGMIQTIPAPAFRTIEEQDWTRAWRQHYRPIRIGRRLVVLPAWMESADPSRIAIKIDPGMAFGTGTHPSTQQCLEVIDRVLSAASDDLDAGSRPTFIDVGCGSGILSIAAIRLGAISALGVDIDPESIRNARQNATLNRMGSALTLAVGSAREILDGKFALQKASLVAANILAPILVKLLRDGLSEMVAPGGSLILAGILEGQAPSVQTEAEQAGLTLRRRLQEGDWVALHMSMRRTR